MWDFSFPCLRCCPLFRVHSPPAGTWMLMRGGSSPPPTASSHQWLCHFASPSLVGCVLLKWFQIHLLVVLSCWIPGEISAVREGETGFFVRKKTLASCSAAFSWSRSSFACCTVTVFPSGPASFRCCLSDLVYGDPTSFGAFFLFIFGCFS